MDVTMEIDKQHVGKASAGVVDAPVATEASEAYESPFEVLPWPALLNVLKFLDWPDRVRLMSTNKALWQLAQSETFWELMCDFLVDYDCIYISQFSRSRALTWKQVFMDYYPLRRRWTDAAPTPQAQTPVGDMVQFQAADAGAAEDLLAQELVDAEEEEEEAAVAGLARGSQASQANGKVFSIRVVARFKPLPKAQSANASPVKRAKRRSLMDQADDEDGMIDRGDGDADADGDAAGAAMDSTADATDADSPREATTATTHDRDNHVVIPIHQRLKMIQTLHKCGPSEARRLLWGGEADGTFDPWKDASVKVPQHSSDGTTAKAKGSATSDGDEKGQKTEASSPSKAQAKRTTAQLPATVRTGVLAVRPDSKDVLICAAGAGIRRFHFEDVLNDTCTQLSVYETAASNAVAEFLNGYNACVMCYGQTGSGKTFSMFGPTDVIGAQVTNITDESGIAPRAIAEAGNAVFRRQRNGFRSVLKLSCIEVFGNEVSDLLDSKTAVGAWHGVAARAVIEQAHAVEVCNAEELEALLLQAEASKKRAATAMNERSSRAHTVMMLSLEQEHLGFGHKMNTILCLADLGGSEQIKKSKAVGERLREAVQINMGLLALKQCMTALRRGRSHVPYSSSMLTQVLRPALDGQCVTTVLVTGSMEQPHTNETLHSMRFGQTCRSIEGRELEANVDAEWNAVEALTTEIEELEKRIQREERWVNKKIVRTDMEGTEVVMTTVLEGAEELRERYEQLLATRRELAGL
eukprot:m.356769 g.356769  ORF g.356769 m.356769 type:complete len:753 (-) comp17623_c0_seq1:300-2558(-)